MTSPVHHVEPADERDRADVAALLEDCGLPTEGLDADHVTLLVAPRGSTLLGCAALEWYGRHVLLRSVAVRDDARGHGLGCELVRRALALARERGATGAYLLTLDAAPFFSRMGFAAVDRVQVRDDAPAVAGSSEFTALCPDSATAMHRPLAGG